MLEFLEDSLLIKNLKKSYTHLQLRCKHGNKTDRKAGFCERRKDKNMFAQRTSVIKCRACKAEMYGVEFVDHCYVPAAKKLKRTPCSKSWKWKEN